MKRYTPWGTLLLLVSLAFILQGCLGIAENSTPNGKTITTNSNGNQVNVAQNLFKGKIYLEDDTGHLLRAQGAITKTPSFFIKKIRFIQDYATVAGFTLPMHVHSEADTRIVGKAVIDILHRDYQLQGSNQGSSQAITDGAN